MLKAIWGWLWRNSRQIGAIAGLLIIGTSLVALFGWIISEPDLAITTESEDLIFPSELGAEVSDAVRADTSGRPFNVAGPLLELQDFLLNTRSLTTVTLSNNTNETLRNVRVRITGLRTMTGHAVSGDGLTPEERSQVSEALHHDDQARLVLGSLAALPPYATLQLHIWGDRPTALYSSRLQPVSASYDGGGGKLVRTTEVRGADAFVADNLGFLLFALLLINISILALMYERFQKQADETP